MKFVTPAPLDGDIHQFGKPRDWDESNGPCGTLPVRRQVEGTPAGRPFIGLYSNWKPDADELARLNAGGVVELMCCGTQPAVSVSVVPCADPEAPKLDKATALQTLRNILADELLRNGEERFAAMVRTGADNSHGGTAAIAAMERVCAPNIPAFSDVRGAVARGWCHEPNTAKEMDGDLAEAISREVATLYGSPLPNVT